MKKVLLIFSSCLLVVLSAQNFELVKVIYPSSNGYPREMTEINGKFVFSALDGVNGRELWVSDGTESGTNILKDIYPGFSGSSFPEEFENFGGLLYFAANDGTNGRELWVTDGTISGTSMLKDINSTGYSNPSSFTEYNGKLYFSAYDNVKGFEPWVTDGTVAGTQILKDINPVGSSLGGFTSLELNHFLVYKNKLYFMADDGTHGSELWVTDGTSAGTQLVKDINIGPDFSSSVGATIERHLFIFNDNFYFSADDGIHGLELWKSNGTTIGTVRVTDINPGAGNSICNNIIEYKGKLYFGAKDGVSNCNFWTTDGTSTGTHLVKGFDPNITTQFRKLATAIDLIFFPAPDYSDYSELWVSDGTSMGTSMLKDINSTWHSYPSFFHEYNGKVYFIAHNDNNNGWELHESDGTDSGTSMIAPLQNSPNVSPMVLTHEFFEFNGSLYFSASYNSMKAQLWKYTTEAPTAIRDLREKINFKVYPNPTNSHLFIESNEQILNSSIFDLQGKTIQENFNSTTLDVNSLVSGFYFIQITTKTGIGVRKIYKN